MALFQWNGDFVTGLETVDEQHRHLVALINNLGERLAHNRVGENDLADLFRELRDYADRHFSDEEELMAGVGIDPRHSERHAEIHRRFLGEIEALQAGSNGVSASLAASLLDYLVHWLTFHILSEDMRMARQIASVRAGEDPATAFEAAEAGTPASSEPLLAALNGLLAQLSERNRELAKMNLSLERRVADRTRQLTEVNAKLEALSLQDDLTGLSNRRHAVRQLELLWKHAGTSGEPLSVLMIDADRFKQVNDTHGHAAGDSVLVTIAKTLRDSVRTDDIVARMGGDEFLVICPTTDAAGAAQIAEQLRQRLAALRVPIGSEAAWSGSISIGVATRTSAMTLVRELVRAADECVYRAKRAGGNAVRMPGRTPHSGVYGFSPLST